MSIAKHKIHFLSMVGVDVDADIIPYWADHYRDLNLDSYVVFLHLSKTEKKNQVVERYLNNLGFTTIPLPNEILRDNKIQPLCPDEVRSETLGKWIENLPQKDFVLIADGDEFQEWPMSPYSYLARGLNVVMGELIDCFDDTLHNPTTPDIPLSKQYPIRHKNLSELFKKVPCLTHKICLHPVSYPVNLTGSHNFKQGISWETRRVLTTDPIDIFHYRWRKEAINRMRGRAYWPDEEIAKVEKFFEVVP